MLQPRIENLLKFDSFFQLISVFHIKILNFLLPPPKKAVLVLIFFETVVSFGTTLDYYYFKSVVVVVVVVVAAVVVVVVVKPFLVPFSSIFSVYHTIYLSSVRKKKYGEEIDGVFCFSSCCRVYPHTYL